MLWVNGAIPRIKLNVKLNASLLTLKVLNQSHSQHDLLTKLHFVRINGDFDRISQTSLGEARVYVLHSSLCCGHRKPTRTLGLEPRTIGLEPMILPIKLYP